MSIIVIVDDRSINRTIYAKLAQSIGPEVEARDFGDPAEALAWLARNRADLVITDHDMPQIYGDEFITRFRTLPHSQSVPVMMITVKDQRMLRLRALESGANDFLHSPIDHCEFVVRARNLLKLAQAVEPRAEAAPSQPPPTAKSPESAKSPENIESPKNPAPVANLDACRAKQRERAVAREWRFLPRLDLVSGCIAGAQALLDGQAAELADPEALGAVLAIAGQLQERQRDPVRLTLAARFDGEAPAPLALHLAAQLARTRVPAYWLDLRFNAAEICDDPRRANDEARAFDALGVGLTVDLGALAGEADKGKRLATPLEQFIDCWRPSIAFACASPPAEALRQARRLTRWRGERQVNLIAEGVGSASLLKPLRRAGVREAQGGCFGAPFASRDLPGLFPSMDSDALKRPA